MPRGLSTGAATVEGHHSLSPPLSLTLSALPRLQTAEESVLLVNVGLDTPLRLLAVGRDGPLAVAELRSSEPDQETASDRRPGRRGQVG